MQTNNCSEVNYVNVKQFYGHVGVCSHIASEKSIRPIAGQSGTAPKVIKPLPHRLNNLCGPSQVWSVFSKQKEALDFVKSKRSGLMTFAFQKSDGTRSFLVAHPQIFWHYDIQKNPAQRCSYEIIPEFSACKLYFDLEYDMEKNPFKQNCIMVESFILLVLHFIKVTFNIKLTREDVIDLDSSSEVKFSRHLIFQTKTHVFCNYQSAGEFVRYICQKLLFYLESFNLSIDSENHNEQLGQSVICKCCQFPSLKNKGCVKDANILLNHLNELVVLDKKGNKCLVCDLSVYSKNRHFRVYQNTKWMKNVPLVVSKDNTYKPDLFSERVINDNIVSEAFFLDSLVSYIRSSQTSSLALINFVNPLGSCFEAAEKNNESAAEACLSDNYATKSPYPEIDDFIKSLVSPGRIWRLAYFNSTNTIVYDIIGNRYCHNIKRQHRSNNVKYIVHLKTCTYYQKCYDIDCGAFRSKPLPLPDDLKFQLDDDCGFSDSDLIEVASVVEDISFSLADNDPESM